MTESRLSQDAATNSRSRTVAFPVDQIGDRTVILPLHQPISGYFGWTMISIGEAIV
jgi:hypothetical protein